MMAKWHQSDSLMVTAKQQESFEPHFRVKLAICRTINDTFLNIRIYNEGTVYAVQNMLVIICIYWYLDFSFQMADRLLSTIGQDILDALFWTATEPRGRKREHLGTLPHLLLAIVYVSIL